MSLKKEQYDNIMADYAAARDRHKRELQQRRARAYARVPALQQMDAQTPARAVALLKKRLLEREGDARADAGPSPSFRPAAERIAAERARLLTANGFPADYLEMEYDCPDCRDTGYAGGHKCHCLKKKETAVLYGQARLDVLAKNAGFEALSEEYYAGEDLALFRKARANCLDFVKTFDTSCRNLYLCGTVGTGKTMLSVCVAKALVDRGKSVLYFSAASLFDRLADYTFGSFAREGLRDFSADLFGCDLLIIDDLGTEFTNAFVASQLFTCINERALGRRPTIISTNLSLRDLQARYSDRVFSRITSSYEILKLSGRDIRLLQRRQGRRAGRA